MALLLSRTRASTDGRNWVVWEGARAELAEMMSAMWMRGRVDEDVPLTAGAGRAVDGSDGSFLELVCGLRGGDIAQRDLVDFTPLMEVF